MIDGFLPLLGLILGPLLIVLPIGLIIGVRWSWQTAKSKGRTNRGLLGYCFSGEGRGFSPRDDTFEGLLARSNPWCLITVIIIILNILIFVAMVLSQESIRSLYEPEIEQLVLWGANYGPLTIRGEWWRLLSSTFIHAGFLHLFFNMWFFWILGNYAERMFGNLTFLVLYGLSGLGGSVASLLWDPARVSLGASGAILGVAGATVMFLVLQKPQILRAAQKSNLAIMLLYLGYNLALGLGQSGIDNAGHLGGLFVGIVLGGSLHHPLPPLKAYSGLRHYVVLSSMSLFLILGSLFAKTQVVNNPVTTLLDSEKLIELGKYDQAMADLDKVLESNPRLAAAYYLRGILYQRKNEHIRAISDFDKAIELNPRFAEAYNNRGIVYESESQYDRALSDYSEAIKLNPRFASAYANRATIMRKLGNMKMACWDWKVLCEQGDCSYYEKAKRKGDCE